MRVNRVRVIGLEVRALPALRGSLATAMECAKQTRQPLSVVAIRLDNHALIDQVYGSAMVVALMEEISARLRRGTRGGGFLGRLSADTLILALPRVETLFAEVVASRITDGRTSAVSRSGLITRVHLSTGVAQAGKTDTADTLIARAVGAATPVAPVLCWNLAA
jgi:GGDEF domain-containing protein